LSVVEGFKDENAGPFAHYETVAIDIERARKAARREGCHIRKSSNTHRRNDCFGTSSDGYVNATRGHQSGGVANGMGSSGARCRNGLAWTTGAKAHRDGGCRGIGHHHGNQEWRHSVRTAVIQYFELLDERLESTNASSDDAGSVGKCGVEARLQPSFVGGCQSKECEGV
jgi:hypothetical protein